MDLLYANIKDAYTSSPLPPLCCSDHILVHLVTDYTPVVTKHQPVKRLVKQWSEEATDRLRDSFETTDWEALCSPHSSDIDSMTQCITDYINFCVENTVPSKLFQCFPNNKPWVTSGIKALLNEKKRVFASGDREELRRVQKELRQRIRKGKDIYRRKLEKRLEQNSGWNRTTSGTSGEGCRTSQATAEVWGEIKPVETRTGLMN